MSAVARVGCRQFVRACHSIIVGSGTWDPSTVSPLHEFDWWEGRDSNPLVDLHQEPHLNDCARILPCREWASSLMTVVGGGMVRPGFRRLRSCCPSSLPPNSRSQEDSTRHALTGGKVGGFFGQRLALWPGLLPSSISPPGYVSFAPIGCGRSNSSPSRPPTCSVQTSRCWPARYRQTTSEILGHGTWRWQSPPAMSSSFGSILSMANRDGSRW